WRSSRVISTSWGAGSASLVVTRGVRSPSNYRFNDLVGQPCPSPRLPAGQVERPVFKTPTWSLCYASGAMSRARLPNWWLGAVRAAVSGLAKRQRAALEMYQFQNRSYAEIAAALALTTKATKSLLYRARMQLKGFLHRLQDI